MKMNKHDYIKLIESFLNVGYQDSFFHDYIESSEKVLLLRHDVDFDLAKALEMAKVENSLGVRSTYFFLLSSSSYNLLAPESLRLINNLKYLGHEVSLHFDPTVYKDFLYGLNEEVEIFEKVVQTKVRAISFHRPAKDLLNNKVKLPKNIVHTYEEKYFKHTKYISDSGGKFKYGHPLDSNEFRNRKNMQLLTHPIWWFTEGREPVDKLKFFMLEREKLLSLHVARNCIPWKKYIAE